MTSIIRINKDGSGQQGLESCSVVPAEAVLSGVAKESGEFHYSTDNGAFLVGVWECTPYVEILNYPTENEYCMVLKGKVSLTNPDGSIETFAAGDSYVVPAGFKGKFEVHETLRKIYVIYST